MPASPTGAAVGKLSRAFEQMRGRGHRQLLELDDETVQGAPAAPATPAGQTMILSHGRQTPQVYSRSPSVADAGRPAGVDAQTFMRSPESASSGRLSRALGRVRGRGRQQLLELDDDTLQVSSTAQAIAGQSGSVLAQRVEGGKVSPAARTLVGQSGLALASQASAVPAAPLTPDAALAQFDAASGPSLAAFTGFGLAPVPSTPARQSPGATAAGKVSRAFDRMRGRRSQQLLEQDGAAPATAPASKEAGASCVAEPRTQGSSSGLGGGGGRHAAETTGGGPLQRDGGAHEPAPRLLGTQHPSWSAQMLPKLGGRRGEEKSRML